MEVDDILRDFEADSAKPARANISARLTQAMLNERMAPEILPYEHELMQETLTQIENQQQYLLDCHEYGDSNADSGLVSGDFKLQLMIIETDIERLNFLVRVYLRARLAKLDDYNLYYINLTSDEDNKMLSQAELEYLRGHFKILTKLYNNSFLKKMPEFLTLLDDTSGGQSMITAPDTNELVFVRIRGRDLTVSTSEEDFELVARGIYVVRYSLIARYIQSGDIDLI
ncbi:DNA replication complex GINS protein SLD5 [Meyerozyma sp. JA9]|nr:DNA replication complex GINS protein SLD5 [Meyerozyma sp. JA9]